MRCDMCGSEEQLYRTDIEGAELAVCKSCSGHGNVIERIEEPVEVEETKTSVSTVPERPEIITIIAKDCPRKIKQAREKKGLKQAEMAKRLGEKASVIHQLETGHMEPSMELARKLERFLGITLVEEYEEDLKTDTKSGSGSGELTIGDMIKIK